MHFTEIEEFNNLEMGYISDFSGGYISRNRNLLKSLDLNKFSQFILEKCVYGTPIFKLGNRGSNILILSGIHGNELPPQLASIRLLNFLLDKDLNHTVYVIPFACPKATMDNQRTFDAIDLNRSAHIDNSVSNLIVRRALELEIDVVGDFHSTAYNSNPGKEAVFTSKSPTPESFLIANYISRNVGSDIIAYDYAGASYQGAVEDVFNLNHIPAVTCEVLSPFASVGEGSVETSFSQMIGFLSYFGIF